MSSSKLQSPSEQKQKQKQKQASAKAQREKERTPPPQPRTATQPRRKPKAPAVPVKASLDRLKRDRERHRAKGEQEEVGEKEKTGEEDDEEAVLSQRRQSAPRRQKIIASDDDEQGAEEEKEEEEELVQQRLSGASAGKRRKAIVSDSDDEEVEDAPPAKMPRRQDAKRAAIVASSSDEDDAIADAEEEPAAATPAKLATATVGPNHAATTPRSSSKRARPTRDTTRTAALEVYERARLGKGKQQLDQKLEAAQAFDAEEPPLAGGDALALALDSDSMEDFVAEDDEEEEMADIEREDEMESAKARLEEQLGKKDMAFIEGLLEQDKHAQLEKHLKRKPVTAFHGLLVLAAQMCAPESTRLILSEFLTRAPKRESSALAAAYEALHVAMSNGWPGIVRALVEGAGQGLTLLSEATHADGLQTLLHSAGRGGNGECVQLTLDAIVEQHDSRVQAGSMLRESDAKGASPLLQAAGAEGGTAAVKVMIDFLQTDYAKEAAVLHADDEGATSAHWAAEAGEEKTIALLAAVAPAVIRRKDLCGASPLHTACSEGRAACVRQLLALGANPTQVDNQGWPPILYAIFADHRECAAALLDHAAERQLLALNTLLTADGGSRIQALKVLKFLAEVPAYYDALNGFLSENLALLGSNLAFLLERPGLLSFRNRRAWAQRELTPKSPFSSFNIGVDNPYNFFPQMGSSFAPPRSPLVVRSGDEVFQDFVTWVEGEGGTDALRTPLWHHLRFVESSFSSGPGVEREFMGLCARAMTANAAGAALFHPCAEGLYEPAPATVADSKEAEARIAIAFEACGWLLGYAVAQHTPLPLPLAPHVLHYLLGRDPTEAPFDELQMVDSQYHRSLSYILENDPEPLAMTFVASDGAGGEVALEPGGSETPVTEQNKERFVRLSVQHRLAGLARMQLTLIKRGLAALFPSRLLRLFSAPELGLLLTGETEIDVADWERETVYSGAGLTREAPLARWFWAAVRRFSAEERALLLTFATGSPRPPVGGFAELSGMGGPQRFTVELAKHASPDTLPTAATCFNLLKLPPYATAEQLEERLCVAVRFGAQGFTFA
mmetsp:Transcript_22540/g.73244  ORF Transcript_22540/g.73244 Transcript_22540/m.73244 type:complete len:1071 (-) Transcript_22540:136-3348(-)